MGQIRISGLDFVLLDDTDPWYGGFYLNGALATGADNFLLSGTKSAANQSTQYKYLLSGEIKAGRIFPAFIDLPVPPQYSSFYVAFANYLSNSIYLYVIYTNKTNTQNIAFYDESGNLAYVFEASSYPLKTFLYNNNTFIVVSTVDNYFSAYIFKDGAFVFAGSAPFYNTNFSYTTLINGNFAIIGLATSNYYSYYEYDNNFNLVKTFSLPAIFNYSNQISVPTFSGTSNGFIAIGYDNSEYGIYYIGSGGTIIQLPFSGIVQAVLNEQIAVNVIENKIYISSFVDKLLYVADFVITYPFIFNLQRNFAHNYSRGVPINQGTQNLILPPNRNIIL